MNESIEFGGNLDGTWSGGSFKLIIKGNTYVSRRYNGSLYGKGNYIVANDELTVSNVDGRYSELNGIWINIKCKKRKL
jgi:hypothetical protein